MRNGNIWSEVQYERCIHFQLNLTPSVQLSIWGSGEASVASHCYKWRVTAVQHRTAWERELLWAKEEWEAGDKQVAFSPPKTLTARLSDDDFIVQFLLKHPHCILNIKVKLEWKYAQRTDFSCGTTIQELSDFVCVAETSKQCKMHL